MCLHEITQKCKNLISVTVTWLLLAEGLVWVFHKLLGFSLELTKNGAKNNGHPLRGRFAGKHSLFMRMATPVRYDRRFSVTWISTFYNEENSISVCQHFKLWGGWVSSSQQRKITSSWHQAADWSLITQVSRWPSVPNKVDNVVGECLLIYFNSNLWILQLLNGFTESMFSCLLNTTNFPWSHLADF